MHTSALTHLFLLCETTNVAGGSFYRKINVETSLILVRRTGASLLRVAVGHEDGYGVGGAGGDLLALTLQLLRESHHTDMLSNMTQTKTEERGRVCCSGLNHEMMNF